MILIFNQEIDYDQIDMKQVGPETDDFGIKSKNWKRFIFLRKNLPYLSKDTGPHEGIFTFTNRTCVYT